MRCALIDKDGLVVNVIVADESESFPGHTLKETNAKIGDAYDKVLDKFVAPQEEMPVEITSNGTL